MAGIAAGRDYPGVTNDSPLLRYHEATKHSPWSVTRSGHRLDWSIKPLPFKIYRDLETVEPPAEIARLCRLSNGVLRWRRFGSERVGFRAAPCTGALYHVELYLATAERADLPAGLYHYGAHDGLLRRLRGGDVRGTILHATGGYEPVAQAPLLFVLSSTFWRNAWKYQARAYRHAFWDGGAVVGNLLAVLAAERSPASVIMGFSDDELNELLGLDGSREAATAIVAVGEGTPTPPPASGLPALSPATEPLSSREVRYPEIETAHRATGLGSGPEVTAWRVHSAEDGHTPPLPMIEGSVDEVIERRRSARSFGRRPLTLAQLRAVLQAAALPIPGDAFTPPPLEPFLIVNSVEGLQPGAYDGSLRPIRSGDFRRAAADLALWQELAGEAAVNVYFLADLEAVLDRLGERGYRVAQMAGGICGEQAELAATGFGLAATGLTFFDDAATEFFEPAAKGRQIIYLEAVGTRRQAHAAARLSLVDDSPS